VRQPGKPPPTEEFLPMRPTQLHQRFNPSPLALAAAMAIALAAGHAPLAHAQSGAPAAAAAPITFNIPAQPLGQALNELARQANLQMTFPAGLVAGKQSPAVAGNLTLRQALDQLLAGSGLVAQIDGASVLIKSAPPVAGGDAVLPAVIVTGASDEEVATGPVLGYKASRSATATRIDLPLQDQPVSVKVIPAEVIADLGVRNATEVADYVAGVARESTAYSPKSQSFFIRGFSSYGSAATLNGFRQEGFMSATDTSAVERIEFLKGPAAVLYGASSAISGIVNTVTKRPTAGDFTSIELSGGQFGYARATLDANHALGSDALLGRVNIAMERDDGFRSYPGSRVNTLFAITPIVSAQLSPDTRVELELSAVRFRFGGRCDGVYPAPELVALSIRKQVICDDLAHAETDTYSARMEVEHRLDAQWSLRAAGFFSRTNSDRTEQYPVNFRHPLSADGRTIERFTQFATSYDINQTGQLELRGNLSLGGMQHRVIVGLDLTRAYLQYADFNAPTTPMDIFEPRYKGQLLGPFEVNIPALYSRSKSTALYVQDFIEIGTQWKLLLGLRHDRVDSEDGDVEPRLVSAQQTESANSPRVGLVFQPAPNTSIYASWSESFAPNSGSRARDGSVFPAERGVQYEIGIKQDLLNKQMNVTASVFDLTRRNVLTADPNDRNFRIATGEQRSRGFELEVVGQITPAWQVIGAYTYLDAKVTKDNRIPVGSKLVGAARHSGSLWNKVALGSWGLPDWSVGFGVVASGDREARLPNIPITLGSYVRYDAGVFYTAGPWQAQLNVKNISDERIFVGKGFVLVPQTPRSVNLNVKYTF
jgi:iron complex outermembrane receptor protein